MASRTVVSYETPLSRGFRWFSTIFIGLYVVWTVLPRGDDRLIVQGSA
jgi:multiple sugar transport system permease protein